MTEAKVEAQSATIYQFPKRGRFATDSRDGGRNVISPRFAKTAAGAWYHDEAIAQERTD